MAGPFITYHATHEAARAAMKVCGEADFIILSPPNHDRACWMLKVTPADNPSDARAPRRFSLWPLDGLTICATIVVCLIILGNVIYRANADAMAACETRHSTATCLNSIGR